MPSARRFEVGDRVIRLFDGRTGTVVGREDKCGNTAMSWDAGGAHPRHPNSSDLRLVIPHLNEERLRLQRELADVERRIAEEEKRT